jgi:hypothetical protein
MDSENRAKAAECGRNIGALMAQFGPHSFQRQNDAARYRFAR